MKLLLTSAGSSPMTSGLRVAVVDGQTIDAAAPLPAPSEAPDIRVSAVTPASVRLFKGVFLKLLEWTGYSFVRSDRERC